MRNDKNTLLERLIAKIDNDFNPDNSDWIPRVGAWAIDAMSMIDCLPMELVRTNLKVENRIATTTCHIGDNFKVYDKNGCVIKEYNKDIVNSECSSCSTGEFNNPFDDNDDHNKELDFVEVQAETINGVDNEHRYNYHNIYKHRKVNKYFIKLSEHQLEINFDTDYIVIEHEHIKTYCSDQYGCELPVIPNNGRLLEAIANYCMYKMLCRGYKHPVFNLQASQYGTNPYYTWMQLKEEAKRSIINDGVDNSDLDGIWRSAFYISAFDPKRN